MSRCLSTSASACSRLAADAGPKGNVRRFAGCDAHAPPQRQHGIENRSGRIGQRPRIHDRDGIAQIVPAAEKARPIGFELQAADALSLQNADVGHPKAGIRRIPGPRAWPAARRSSATNSVCTNSLENAGCAESAVGRRQHDLGVGRQFDFADAGSLVGHRDPADLGIVLARHQDLGRGEDGSVAAGDFRAILEKGHLVAVGFAPDRLISGRPNLTVRHVAQEDVAAPRIAGRILAPAGHGDIPPAAVAGAGGGQHHGIVAVRQQMGARRDVMRRGEAARRRRPTVRAPPARLYLVRTRCGHDRNRAAFVPARAAQWPE